MSHSNPIIRKYVDGYKAKLESLCEEGCSIQKLMSTHSNISKQIEATLKASARLRRQLYPLEESDNAKSDLDTIKATLSEILSEILEIHRWRQDEDTEEDVVDPLVDAAVTDQFPRFYKEELDNYLKLHKYIQPTKLRNAHTVVSREAVLKYKESQQLTASQELELKDVVERSFETLKTRNMMALNWHDNSEPAIGIDLGTTFCCSAIYLKGEVRIIPNRLGYRTTPSYVRLENGGNVVVGKYAKDNAYRYPKTTIYDAKRLIGRRFDDPLVQKDLDMWSFNVKEGSSGPVIFANDREFPPEQISAYLLKQLKKEAEEFLKCPVKKAVITVPAYFNDAQRQATIDAGEMAGLQVLTILNEPTAAAMAYKLERFHEDTQKVLIFDFGGGTFDVALLETDGQQIDVVSATGDTHLGGGDIDKNLTKNCAEKLRLATGVDLLENLKSSNEKMAEEASKCLRRIQSYCEESKIELSTGMISEMAIDKIIGNHDLVITMQREEMERLNQRIFQRAMTIVEDLLGAADVEKEEIDDIILIGGSTKIPVVQENLKSLFNCYELNHTINPDEAVAHGAAIQAAILNGSAEAKKRLNYVIKDVIPMSLGVECIKDGIGGIFSIIIPKDTKIPTRRQDIYTTVRDGQTSVAIKIYQGESKTAAKNTLLGKFMLNGIPPAPAHDEKIDVIMEVKETGILRVIAVSRSSGKSKSLTIKEFRGRLPAALRRQITKELSSE